MNNKFLCLFLFFILFTGAFCSASAQEVWEPFSGDLDGEDRITCTVNKPYTEQGLEAAALPPVTDSDWIAGPDDATITIIEYGDLQCQFSASAVISIISFQKNNPDDVRFVFRHYPLSFHPLAKMAAYAVEAAGAQPDKFFDVLIYLSNYRYDWGELDDEAAFKEWLIKKLPEAASGIDMDQWKLDFEDDDMRKRVDSAYEEVRATGLITETPTLFMNSIPYKDTYSEKMLTNYLNFYKLQQRLYQDCPPALVDSNKNYRAVVETSKSNFVINLFADETPDAVSNFIYLAQSGWFNENTFYNQDFGFALMSGDPSNTSWGDAGYSFPIESSTTQFGPAGRVAMLNRGGTENGSQFFITYNLEDFYSKQVDMLGKLSTSGGLSEDEIKQETQEKLSDLSDRYTIIGQVSEDTMRVFESLLIGDSIISVKIEESAKQ